MSFPSACCSVPAVEAEYTAKGSYETIAGKNVYVQPGKQDSKKLIILVHDIFGITPQSLQATDLLAASTGATLWQPDFFDGEKLDHGLFSPAANEEEQKKKNAEKQRVFSTFAAPPTNLAKLEEIIAVAREKGFTSVGAVGFCWGAKIVFVSSKLDAKAACHPSLLTAEDAASLNVPTALYPSMNEDKEIMATFEKALSSNAHKEKNAFQTYTEQIHGWAAARADLSQAKDREAFGEIYARLSKFFSTVL